MDVFPFAEIIGVCGIGLETTLIGEEEEGQELFVTRIE
jgi:hypothetical protein